MKRRLLSLFLVACLGMGVLSTMPMKAVAVDENKAIQAGAAQLQGMSADSVYFGTYQQSSNGAGGFNVDPIKWDVLANSDGKLFVVSDQALDYRVAHTSGSNLDWKQRSLRTWLNGTTTGNFYADAFGTSEKTAVALTTVTTVGDTNTSDDYVFILSKEEATTYFADNNARKWTYTEYAKSKEGTVGGHFTHQWLRNRDSSYNWCGVLLTPDGAIVDNEKHHFGYAKQIRPAFNLDTSKVLFTSPAVGGKTGTGLETVGTYDGNEWKVTLLDSNRSNFTVEVVGVNGNMLTVNYTNAVTGSNEYISAIVQNNTTGEYTKYGTVKALADASDANGTAQLNISGVDFTEETLYVFNEQRNGDKKTDYASALQDVNGNAVSGNVVKAIEAGAIQLEGMSADSVYFGSYQQSSDGAGGFNVDPIKWDVLANSDGKLFMVSDQALDYRQAHTTGSNLDWKQRSLRTWLNGTTAGNFYADAFAENEKSAVALTTVTTVGDANTSDDYVFVLSKEEATEYFADNNARKWTYTEYVQSKNGTISGHFTHQWLRNRDSSYNWCGVLLTPDGAIVDNVQHHFGYAKQVRPAFNLDLDKVLFTSAAINGKTGTGISEIGAYDGNEWKVTLLDSNRSTFTASLDDAQNSNIIVNYANAKTGANEYISVLIKDANTGDYTHYGRIKNVIDASDASGSIQLSINAADLNGKTLYVFNEQCNGDKQTDYASALKAVTPELYQIDTDVDTLDFGSISVGSAQPEAKMVTVTNTGLLSTTVTLPISENYDIVAGEGFTGTTAEIAVGGSAKFTVQPKAGLAINSYNTTVVVNATGESKVEIALAFKVREADLVITTSATGVTITPQEGYSNLVEHGANFAFTVELQDGYHLVDDLVVKENGSPLTAQDGVYTIYSITENKNITVESVEACVYESWWAFDSENHWHECTCGYKNVEENHTLIIVDGEKVCSVCKYAIGQGTDIKNEEGSQQAGSGTGNGIGNGTGNSPDTGDHNSVTFYIIVLCLATVSIASITVYNKRKIIK